MRHLHKKINKNLDIYIKNTFCLIMSIKTTRS